MSVSTIGEVVARLSISNNNGLASQTSSEKLNANSTSSKPPNGTQAATTTTSKKSSDSRAKRNLTLMIVSISFLFTLGTLPWAIYYTLTNLINVPNSYPFQVIASCCLYLLVSLKIFIYYFFNRLFRQIIRQNFASLYACCCFRCKR